MADTGNDRVVELSPGGSVLAEWGSRGTADGRFRLADAASPSTRPATCTCSTAKTTAWRCSTPSGRFLAKWGLRGIGPGEFSQPTAIAVGCEGDVYVADTNNNRVERFDLVSPAPAGCLAPGAWPPPLDVAPVLQREPAARPPACWPGARWPWP